MRKDFILTENAYGKKRYDAPTSKYEQTLLLTDSVTKFLLFDSVEIFPLAHSLRCLYLNGSNG